MKKLHRWACLLLAAALAAGLALPALGAEQAPGKSPLAQAAERTAAYLSAGPLSPGAVGGDWAAMALARSDYPLPDGFFRGYLRRLDQLIAEKQGVLDARKSSEYSRAVLALTALGQDPAQAAGYDLLAPLFDREAVLRQGINGPVYALIALDSGDYACPEGLRQSYLEEILSRQMESGGWSLTAAGGAADADLTAMVLQALAGYRNQPQVEQAVQKGTDCLSRLQGASGGFAAQGQPNAESCAQVLLAMCALELELEDSRFVKEGHTVLDCLLSYQREDGGFAHLPESQASDRMASEQAFCALTALLRRQAGRPGLYQMAGDAKALSPAAGLPGKDPAVALPPVCAPDAGFSDLAGLDPLTQDAALTLARRGVLTGMPGGAFNPEGPLTRAQFAAMLTRALGLEGGEDAFSDVKPGTWYAPYIRGAAAFGLIAGKGDGRFDPEGPVTWQEAAVMLRRAFALCGGDTRLTPQEKEAALAGLPGGGELAAWSEESAAVCRRWGLIRPEQDFQPRRAMTRGEAAASLMGLLEAAELV